MADEKKIVIGEAVAQYLRVLSPDERAIGQQVLAQLARWFGQGRCLDGLDGAEVEKFCRTIPETDAVAAKKLDILKRFLEDARKKYWTKTNLGAKVKVRKSKTRGAMANSCAKPGPESIVMTKEGLEKMKQELAALKEKRVETLEDIRRAAADKDFRENAPLAAAREQLGHIDGRIMEIEETLKVVAVAGDKPSVSLGAGIGDAIDLTCLDTGESLHYILVGPREVDVSRGRISGLSPLGKAIVGHGPGDIVEITVPVGKIKYRIEELSER
jgi:transcription elongation factor GreA